MTLRTLNVGTTDDGFPLTHYHSDGHVLLTGPIQGVVTLPDGTRVDVSPAVIEVASPEQAGLIHHLIGERHEAEGHPKHDGERPFVHFCTSHCGELARDITHPYQAIATDRAATQVRGVEDPVHAHEIGQALGLIDPSAPPPVAFALASATAETAALNGLDGTGSTNVIPDVSLHTASPGTTGANENANTGSYARQACSWNAGSAGSKTNSSALTFATAGTFAVTHGGTWSSAVYGAGNYAIGFALGSSVTAASITVAAGAIALAAA